MRLGLGWGFSLRLGFRGGLGRVENDVGVGVETGLWGGGQGWRYIGEGPGLGLELTLGWGWGED